MTSGTPFQVRAAYAALRGDDEDGLSDSLATGGESDRSFAVRRRRTTWWEGSLFLVAVTASLLSLLFLGKIALFDGRAAASARPPPPPPPPDDVKPSPADVDFRRPDSDFLLGMDWDYNAPPTVREYHWTIRNIEANPDGVFRTLTTINGKFPGELIRCNEGDTIVVHVENRAANATALHWHGLFQNGTNHMDGTPGATQCPIAPGRSFRYEFQVKGQAGTYFYHGHQGAEALDGLVGPLVIHARDEPAKQQLPYDSDRVVMVQDYYHDLASGLLEEALAPGSEAAPMPNGALINGAHVVDCDGFPGRRCDNSTARLAALDLAAGGRHRLRFINSGGFAWLEVTIDRHHRLLVTEIDGVDVAPASETSLLIAPGQRYSVVLTANETSANADDAFWLRARIATHCFAEYALANQDQPVARAMVRYAAATSQDPTRRPATTADSGDYAVLCRDMRTDAAQPRPAYAPVPPRAAPAYADRSFYLRVNLEIGSWRLQRGFFNGSSYRPNLRAPVLHRAVDGQPAAAYRVSGVNDVAFDAQSELVLGVTATDDKSLEVIDLVLQNFDEGSHPLHLHGHQMFVLGAGHGYFPGYGALGLAPLGRGLLDPGNDTVVANPTRRDTAAVEGFGWTLVRVVADNPGVWKFHCHMVWHGDAGMGLLLLARPGRLQQHLVLPPDHRALCDATDAELQSGAAPPDSRWYGNGVD